MKKWTTFLLLVLLCMMAISAQASQKLNIYIEKEAILAHDISAADIRIRPEGMVHVTHHSLWPWDEAGEKWSMFVEIENISKEKIVIDEDWMIACKANRDEIASAENIFDYTTNVLEPGEKTVLHAGTYPYVQEKRSDADVSFDTWDVEGLSDFAAFIRQADILRVRLETRGAESSQSWQTMEIEPKIWIDGRTVYFEWTNETDDEQNFRMIGAVVRDGEGRIVDVIRESYSRKAIVAPGGTLSMQKELAPYVVSDMISGAAFEAFAYKMGEN